MKSNIKITGVEETIIKMAKDLADVRRIGVSLCSRKEVIKVLRQELGYFNTADYIEKYKGDYTNLVEVSEEY